MMPDFQKHIYSLSLSNGHRWSILNFGNSSSTVDDMADIMSLDHSGKCTYERLIYFRDELNNSFIKTTHIEGLDNLPADGWNNHIVGRVVFWTHPDVSDIICNLGTERGQVSEALKIGDSISAIYDRETKSGGLPIHAALVERDGNGVLLAARGNTGKSTCCQRIPEPWHALCDDEALVIRLDRSRYDVHPFPTWSNFVMDRPKRKWAVQKHVTLRSIFFLEQADRDKAEPIGYGEAASRIFYSSSQAYYRMLIYMNPESKALLKKQLFSNACEIGKTVPAYNLKVDLHGKFWEEIDRTLDKTE